MALSLEVLQKSDKTYTIGRGSLLFFSQSPARMLNTGFYQWLNNQGKPLFQRSVLELFQGAAELVGAGGVLRTAADAFQTRDDIVYFLSLDKFADALQVTWAAACEEYLLDNVILIGCDIDKL